ncbi:MAG: desulfoferrodoxin [Desulfuromonas sp.]|uniref:class II SORL domain-containing protein n=1 Tax=Desulfuromonas sp. TaxID=892 RepID=UPI000CBC004B|nr:class II SORL domain-containing protein [Desulfuromonas sp.]PLX82674.1 MAG: desulfoferrodoxin [Desulfuromonas sp.]
MDGEFLRRDFLRRAALVGGGLVLVGPVAAGALQGKGGAGEDGGDLFRNINRVRDPQQKTALEMKHAPVISLPGRVKEGEPFAVRVAVGEIVHPMIPAHYIAYLELLAGNEPAGRIAFRPGYSVPVAAFHLVLERPVTLVARAYCNLHGLWESRREIDLS